MRAIISREISPGRFAEVGTNSRTIFSGSSVRAILRKATVWANGQPFRAEWFSGESIYGDPQSVTIHRAVALQSH